MDSKQPETSNKSESSTKSTNYPGMWRFRNNPEYCSIYRVPNRLHRVNPEAYTPQLVLIGPLNHSLKSQASKSLGDITDKKSMGYLNMEEHKKIYLAKYEQEFGDVGICRRIIEENEEKIRESYSESTAWIKSQEFVEMILYDCIFIVQFILKSATRNKEKTGDPLIDEPCLQVTVQQDLLLLENQLPYFILNELFDERASEIFQCRPFTFRQLIIFFLVLDDLTQIHSNSKFSYFTDLNNSKFSHFTDLNRCARIYKRNEITQGSYKAIEHMYNADKLASGGVKFEAIVNTSLINVRFENGCLKMPCLWVEDDTEMKLRNIMALEQCHYPHEAHVCNYFAFLDQLVDTDKDVDLLVEKGIMKNWIGQHSLVADMVNKLNMGVINHGSYYYDIAAEVNAHYTNPYQRSKAILKRVYFGNMWIGTATVAAVLLLLMTLIQTVASMIQAL
ncbi:hypothetical protein V5N11_020803 [Cardamine amara subsp. amara]|uniref:Uncharacterized protein n=1 Tax=Cardamine amara subsp. amara TaxID=228776 RepID=A0ABD1ASX6_CARAN